MLSFNLAFWWKTFPLVLVPIFGHVVNTLLSKSFSTQVINEGEMGTSFSQNKNRDRAWKTLLTLGIT